MVCQYWIGSKAYAGTEITHTTSANHRCSRLLRMTQSFRRGGRLAAGERLRVERRDGETVIGQILLRHFLHLRRGDFLQLANHEIDGFMRVTRGFERADLACLEKHRVALKYLRCHHLRLDALQLL